MECEHCHMVGCSFVCMTKQRDDALRDRDSTLGYLRAWQTWSSDLHHELGLLTRTTYPGDTAARMTLDGLVREVGAWEKLTQSFEHDPGDISGRATVARMVREFTKLSQQSRESAALLETWESWGAGTSYMVGLFIGALREGKDELVKVRLEAMEQTVRQMPSMDAPLGRLFEHSALRTIRFDACLLAQAWVRRNELAVDPVTRKQIDALADRHYRKGELEPSSDTVPHPWRMTLRLAEAISALFHWIDLGAGAYEGLNATAKRITETAREDLER